MCIKEQFEKEDYSNKGRIEELYEFYNEDIYKNSEENRKTICMISCCVLNFNDKDNKKQKI